MNNEMDTKHLEIEDKNDVIQELEEQLKLAKIERSQLRGQLTDLRKELKNQEKTLEKKAMMAAREAAKKAAKEVAKKNKDEPEAEPKLNKFDEKVGNPTPWSTRRLTEQEFFDQFKSDVLDIETCN